MAQYESFAALYQRAAERKGGDVALESLLPQPLSPTAFAALGSDRLLAQLTKSVFQSGFVWRVVENKWPDFEAHFFGFEVAKILMMPDEMLERKAADPKIIRNLKKVWSIRDNALMLSELERQHGPAAAYLSQWPSSDITGLWRYLQQHGSRLGGNTGPYALRALGLDTFILSRDVEAYLRARGVITGGLRSKTSLTAIQRLFDHWQQESGRSLTTLSALVAFATGDNHVQAAIATDAGGAR